MKTLIPIGLKLMPQRLTHVPSLTYELKPDWGRVFSCKEIVNLNEAIDRLEKFRDSFYTELDGPKAVYTT